MSRFSDEINQRVHNELCRACPHSKQCHEDCTTCDDFNDLVLLYLNGQSHLSKENLEKVFLNKKVHVIIRDPWHPIDADGIVTMVDDACQLHGTWGGLAAIPPYDHVSLVVGEKNGWQVAVDLTGNDHEENIPVLSSPLFETEEQADAWYRGLDIDCSELSRIGKGLDIIMVHYVDGQIEDTYII